MYLFIIFQKYYPDEQPAGMSIAEFSLSLVTLLSSKRSSDDLQTELFDLIGFDRIELIQMLLEHREEIVNSHAQNKQIMKQEIAAVAASKKIISNFPITKLIHVADPQLLPEVITVFTHTVLFKFLQNHTTFK